MKRILHKGIPALLLSLFVFSALRAQPKFPTITTSHIIDDAGILSVETQNSLDHLIQLHEDTTGNQVMVVTVSSLEGYAVSQYANEAFKFYQLGQKGTNNGVLMLVAPNERKVHIEVGYGLEGDLPDALCGRIIQSEILPQFKSGNYDAGVSNGVNALLQSIQGTYVAQKGSDEPPVWVPILFIVFFMGIVFVISLFKGSQSGNYHGGGGRYYGGGWSGGGGGWSGGGGGWSGGGGGFSGGGGASGSW